MTEEQQALNEEFVRGITDYEEFVRDAQKCESERITIDINRCKILGTLM